jgi:ABC-type transport system involved in multi-copper enzyme maturation permease subunit
MNPLWWTQIKAVIRLEIRKTFFAKRGLWIYLLALAPVALFFTHSLVEIHQHGSRQEMATQMKHPVTEQDFAAIESGMTRDEVVAKLGEPPNVRTHSRNIRRSPHQIDQVEVQTLEYTDGNGNFMVFLEDGKVNGKATTSGVSFGQDSYIFAGVFQFFFIRLAVFFGCLGIFMNLFRGEMLDKSLHFYLLAPIRREVLVVGKYLAGLLAAGVIFTTSAALQIAAMLYQFDANTINHYLNQGDGFSQIGAYLGVTVLACVGYGSIFLAAGLLFRNPIVPAAAVLIWEAANPLLPALLKKLSVIYYLKSLCPVSIPVDPGMPPLFALLVSNADPIAAYIAVLGLLCVAAAILATCASGVRRLEINYTTE